MRQKATTSNPAESAPVRFGHRLTRFFTDQEKQSVFHPCSSVAIKIFTAPLACPQSSRALFARFRGRAPLQAIAAAVRGAARNRGETSRNASGLAFWRAIPEKLLPPVPDSCELHGRWAPRKRQWEATRGRH